jgi:hypothetical protein
MGRLHISHEASVELDDDLLEHVFAVVVAKLRRHESVLLEWDDPDGHTEQVLVNTAALVRAEFASTRPDQLDHAWLESLMLAANSNGGICLSVAALARRAGVIPTRHGDPREHPLHPLRATHVTHVTHAPHASN